MSSRHMLALALALTTAAAVARAENAISPDGLKANQNGVTVASVTSDKAGYIVVHTTDPTGTVPGTVIGTAPVQPGHNSDVTVAFKQDLKPGTKLIVMLHEEGDNDNEFDSADKPVTEGRGPVQQFVTVE